MGTEMDTSKMKQADEMQCLQKALTEDGITILQEIFIKESNSVMVKSCDYHQQSIPYITPSWYLPPDQNPEVDVVI